MKASIDVFVIFLMLFGNLLNSFVPRLLIVCCLALNRCDGVLVMLWIWHVLPRLLVIFVCVLMMHSSVLDVIAVRFSSIFQTCMVMYRSLLRSREFRFS